MNMDHKFHANPEEPSVYNRQGAKKLTILPTILEDPEGELEAEKEYELFKKLEAEKEYELLKKLEAEKEYELLKKVEDSEESDWEYFSTVSGSSKYFTSEMDLENIENHGTIQENLQASVVMKNEKNIDKNLKKKIKKCMPASRKDCYPMRPLIRRISKELPLGYIEMKSLHELLCPTSLAKITKEPLIQNMLDDLIIHVKAQLVAYKKLTAHLKTTQRICEWYKAKPKSNKRYHPKKFGCIIVNRHIRKMARFVQGRQEYLNHLISFAERLKKDKIEAKKSCRKASKKRNMVTTFK